MSQKSRWATGPGLDLDPCDVSFQEPQDPSPHSVEFNSIYNSGLLSSSRCGRSMSSWGCGFGPRSPAAGLLGEEIRVPAHLVRGRCYGKVGKGCGGEQGGLEPVGVWGECGAVGRRGRCGQVTCASKCRLGSRQQRWEGLETEEGGKRRASSWVYHPAAGEVGKEMDKQLGGGPDVTMTGPRGCSRRWADLWWGAVRACPQRPPRESRLWNRSWESVSE